MKILKPSPIPPTDIPPANIPLADMPLADIPLADMPLGDILPSDISPSDMPPSLNQDIPTTSTSQPPLPTPILSPYDSQPSSSDSLTPTPPLKRRRTDSSIDEPPTKMDEALMSLIHAQSRNRTDVELMFLACIQSVDHQGTAAQRDDVMEKVMAIVFEFKRLISE